MAIDIKRCNYIFDAKANPWADICVFTIEKSSCVIAVVFFIIITVVS